MHFATISFIVLATASRAVQLSWDPTYDNGTYPLADTACSDGPNGLIRSTRHTLNQISGYPFVGGVPYVQGWNSGFCGACYQLDRNATRVYILAVDTANDGINTSGYAYRQLLGG